MSVIKIQNITKSYAQVCALNDISLTMEADKIYGLFGRNGAGKTTLLNLITNRIFPTSGVIHIDGKDVVENEGAIGSIYYSSESNLYPEGFTMKGVIKWTKEFYPELDIEYANSLCKKFALDPNKKIKSLSTGYNSISKLIIALSSNAKILLFDEPVLGLDAYHRDLFYKELLENYIKSPKTIILSTHIIDEVVDMLEKIVILNDKSITVDESVEDLLKSAYCVSGTEKDVQKYIVGKSCINVDRMTSYQAATIMGEMTTQDKRLIHELNLQISKIELQKLFIYLTNEGRTRK